MTSLRCRPEVLSTFSQPCSQSRMPASQAEQPRQGHASAPRPARWSRRYWAKVSPCQISLIDASIKEIWHGETFAQYRRLHLAGRGAEAWPCRGCSAWLAGIRDWEHGWLKVLKTSGRHLKDVMRKDLGVEVQIYEPPA